MKPLSIVIITYNRAEDALQLAENISALEGLNELVKEVIFVNNHSSQSYQALESFISSRPGGVFHYYDTGENLEIGRAHV